MVADSPVKSLVKKKRITKKQVQETNYNLDNFEQYVTQEADRQHKSVKTVIEETFKDGYLMWSVEESASSGGAVGQTAPILTAWAMPQDANDVDEHRRLRKEFTPVARAIDYLRAMIMGNNLDVLIDDPEDKNKLELKEELQEFMRTIYQDQYTTSLYSLISIMLDEALTVGCSGSEIRYEEPITFEDYVLSVQASTLPVAKSSTGAKEYLFYKSKEPDWKDLKGILQLKLLKNSAGRMKLYRDPRTWEANYWTLDEILSSGDTAMAIHQVNLKADSGQAVKFHPWQVFWLNINRKEFDERGISVIEPVKKTAVLLEKILNSVGEGIYRAGNKKYFIVCGTEKRPWSKPHIRNVMQQIQEMGKRNWTNIPVPYGFDIKDIGGQVFEADAITHTLMEIIAQGMHVPLSVMMPARQSPEGAKAQSDTSFLEIERMRHEFKQAIEQQLFKKQLWCKHGKTRTKQGGAVGPMYVPELEQSTKGLQSPIERLETIVKILNVANPVDPQVKLEIDREFAKILGYDMIKMKTQEDLRKELEVMQKQKEEQEKMSLEKTKLDIKNAKEQPKEQPSSSPFGKQQGKPQAPSKDKQEKRLAGGVNVSKKGQSKPMGSSRVPKESKGIKETVEEEVTEVEEINEEVPIEEFDTLSQGISQHPQHIVPTQEYISQSSQKTEGNYGPQGYHSVVIGKSKSQTERKIDIRTSEEDFITSFINPLTQKEVAVVRAELPYGIAGFSNETDKIYIDTAVPNWMYLGLITHEIFEMTLMETLGFDYKEAHIKATEVEKEAVENLGISWKTYDFEFKRISDEVIMKRNPKPKDPADIRKGKAGGMDSTRYEHQAQENLGGTIRDTTDVAKTQETVPQPQQVHITVETKNTPQEIKITTETKPLEINLKQTESQSQLNEIVSDMAKNKSALYEKKTALLERQELLAIEENNKKKLKIEKEIESIAQSMKESEAKVDEIESRKKAIEEQINTEKSKQETEQKKQEIMKNINTKVNEL